VTLTHTLPWFRGSLPSRRVYPHVHIARRPDVITRAEVVSAYVHPDPIEIAHEVPGNAFAAHARAAGFEVVATAARGYDLPRWNVNAQSSGGPPVAYDQYVTGPLVDSLLVRVHKVGVFDAKAYYVEGRIANAFIREPGGLWQPIGITALTAKVKES